MKYINHSGGARGSDIAWETTGKQYGVDTIAYSFDDHRCLSPSRKILSDDELMEGWEKVLVVSNNMSRQLFGSSRYVRKLLSRNWFQVKNSESIFAIGNIIKPGEKGNRYENKSKIEVVDGGTGYSVELAKTFTENPIFVFDQDKDMLFKYEDDGFKEISYIPKLTPNFAGIGTRELNSNGINFITKVYTNTFE